MNCIQLTTRPRPITCVHTLSNMKYGKNVVSCLVSMYKQGGGVSYYSSVLLTGQGSRELQSTWLTHLRALTLTLSTFIHPLSLCLFLFPLPVVCILCV